jgi:hypothetical protein
MVQVAVSYCEPLVVARALRATAVRSSHLNIIMDLLLGPLATFAPATSPTRGYRMVIVAQITTPPDGERPQA